MGHTRMTTQGTAKRNYNNHPFSGKAGKQQFALAHIGQEFPSRMSCPTRRFAIPYRHSQQEYIQNLKAVAWVYGYDPAQIDALFADGFSEEDIEEMFYGYEL